MNSPNSSVFKITTRHRIIILAFLTENFTQHDSNVSLEPSFINISDDIPTYHELSARRIGLGEG